MPHNLVHEQVEARIILKAIENFLRGKRVTLHLRSMLLRRLPITREHMKLASPLRRLNP
ncbi:hypothetical protein IVB16_31400 [Bradyrhizobium sp. 183]|uniref:hypothetical protein n=1 Tax=unclassified Bradyrhizobium TaxID=2631580 RepID=UPI001FFE51AD|nr:MULTISPECIES: hypothetical protein [unclassified Bradyrhizobium]UPJ79253.1 hypothetical protein IVB17_31400 [Bradyrhizobium sp. 184]UPJ87046.1 hypothetical protein IVB16_31400 [Bradyrhizobium sp. 183]